MAFVIPTIYTALDKLSAPLKYMSRNMDTFAHRGEVGIARMERGFRRFTPNLSEAGKQFLSFASTAAIVAGVMAGITFSANTIKDYETALTSVRTITGLTTEKFKPFEQQIQSVAAVTKSSSIEVAKSFELIASANADLLKSPEALGAVSHAAITLSQATGMSIAEAAGSLTNSMNQFGVGAEKAQEFIDILVTSQAAGTATVGQLAQSLVVAGGTAKAFGLDFDKANALLQGFAKGGKTGAEAGTMLSGVLSKLSKVKKKEFNPAYTDAITVVDNLAKANMSYTDLLKLTDSEGAKWLTTLINQNKIVQELAGNQNVAGAAAEAAKNQNNTLAIALDQLKNKWVNMITGTDKTSKGIEKVRGAVQFLTEHLETVVSLAAGVIGFFIAWKALIIGSKIAMFLFNIALGINNALQKKSLFFTQHNTAAKYADLVTTKLMTAAQWAWNAAMTANPIGLIVVAIIALIALLVVATKNWNTWGAALAIFLGPLGIIISLVQSFRRNWEMITTAFREGGILAGLKAIGKTLLDTILLPLEQILRIAAKATGSEWMANAANQVAQFRKDLGVETNMTENGGSAGKTPLINPKKDQQEALGSAVRENVNNANVNLNINDPNGRATATTDNRDIIKINTTTTLKGSNW